MSVYYPNRGDIVAMNLNPPLGREIAKIRPVLVLSDKQFNRGTGHAVVCPITTKPKDGPLEVRLIVEATVGVVLPERVRSLDWKVRNCQFIEKASGAVLAEVVAKVQAIINAP